MAAPCRSSMWDFYILTILLILPVFQQSAVGQDDGEVPKIGIVGGGIGGTAAAFYLRQLFGDQAEIDVFEGERVGGRLALINIDGQDYEAGGAIIHPKNQYMVNFTQMFGLGRRENSKEGRGTLGLYAGDGIYFQTSSWSAVTMAKLFWRYGWDLKRIQDWVADMLVSFSRIYEYQDKGMAFTTVEDLLRAMDEKFINYTRITARTMLKDAGFSEKFINELVTAGLRDNYGQTPEVHGFVGAVCMAGVEHGLWSIKGGNKQVPERLLKASKANFIPGKVTHVFLVKSDAGTVSYEVQYEKTSAQQGAEDKTGSREYDLVIIASPLKGGSKLQIKFEEFPSTMKVPDIPFHNLEAMFVHGRPNITTFRVERLEDFPGDVATTDQSVFFNKIGEQFPVTQKDHLKGKPDDVEGYSIWKTFLNKVPSEMQVTSLFDSRKDLRLVNWLAYPEYRPTKELPTFVLYDRLYYLNAIEAAASAMEMSVVGARNVALLAYNQWQGNFDRIDEFGFPEENTASESRSDEL
ncbi:hypothetical protein BaRGS_00023952 [Batillaria attramentaria]|uniref:Prenylcysteine lyase domain-containing protein n=1 Tax=Batillaria attramentaria TaxID=370345 RepID=A0ABD0KCC0_9CAEN